MLVLLLVGTVLGFTSITNYKLNKDELLTLNTATGFGHTRLINNTWDVGPVPPGKKVFTQDDYWDRDTLGSVLKNIATYNGNMVAYTMLLHYFIKLAHVDDGLLRGISALCYVISIGLVYSIAMLLSGDLKTALICAGLFALNPFMLQTGHDLRGYSFATMLTLVTSLFILKIRAQQNRTAAYSIQWGLLLGICYGISILCHYFTFYIILGHIVYAAYSYVRYRKNIFLPIGISLFISCLFFAAWWLNGGKEGYQNMEIQDKFILLKTSAQTHTSIISLIMGTVCFINSVTGYYFQYLGYRNSSFFYVLFLPLTVLALALFPKLKDKFTGKDSLAFLAILIVCCIVFLQLSCIKSGHISSLILTRFGAFICPYFMILLGYALSVLLYAKNLLLKVTAIAALTLHLTLGIMCYPIPFQGYMFTYQELARGPIGAMEPNPYPIIANDIRHRYAAGDTVIYNSFIISQDVNLYLGDAQYPIVQEVNPLQKEGYLIKYSGDISK